jgi:anhydro-N-acetylmuramic acid kinase
MDPFIGRTPPKSTGRELYNRDFISKVIQSRITQKLQPADIINTLTEYTAHSIHFNYTAFLEKKHPVDTVVLGGGGASNLYLVNRLQELFGHISVKMVREYGLNEEFKEAIGFAILAHESIYGRSTNVPQVTQASRPAILGKFCPA